MDLGDPLVVALEDQRDRWHALRTLPRHRRARRHTLGEPTVLAAVDPSVWHLHVRLARRRDPATRAALVAEYEPHTRALARRFHRHREPLDDLIQVALEALLLALDRFDPERSTPFVGFANPTIVGSLKRYYRDSGWALRVPRQAHDLNRPIRLAIERLSHDLGREPTSHEVADLLDIDHGDVLAAVAAADARTIGSLDVTTSVDGSTAPAPIGELDGDLRLVENREALRQAMAPLDDDDRLLLQRYFIDGLTQAEIAARMGMSQMHVSRSLSRVLRRLRSRLPPDT